MVGYGRASWSDQIDGLRVYYPMTFTDPSRRDIEAVLLAAIHDAMEARIQEIAAQHPPGPKTMQVQVAQKATAFESILRARHYEAARFEFLMVRPTLDDLLDAPMPDGVEIRDVRPEHLRSIWEADIEAFRDHWGASEPTEETYQAFLADPVKGDTALWRVAWAGDEVAGMVRSYISEVENEQYHRKRGWVENISVRRPWRNRGLARALIAASFPLLRSRGMTEGALTVDAENPTGALRVYESCGFVTVDRTTEFRRALDRPRG